jgi:hypothetical protein
MVSKMAKRAKKNTRNAPSATHEVNPTAAGSGTWAVYRSAPLEALIVNADHLDITENGTLIFLLGGTNGPPQVVVAGDHYLYCTKVR